jgi:amino acid transporter
MERTDLEPDVEPDERSPARSDDLERYGRYRVPRRREPLIPGLELHEVRKGLKPGSRYVRVVPRSEQPFRPLGRPDLLRATEAAIRPRTALEAAWRQFKRLLVGIPLSTAQLPYERLSKVKALAIFSSDAISSSAYATEAILLILVLAGSGALGGVLPIAGAITLLLMIVAFSYRQTVRAYPSGGGAYIVARANLGIMPGLTAAGALMVDYVLTVAVSIAAGVAAITSAAPALHDERVFLAVFFVGLIMLGNLRGVRESGTIFAAPTYLFIFSFGLMIVVGLVRAFFGGVEAASAPEAQHLVATQSLGVFLILRAFASGSAALTGVEAISNGVPAFKPPESRNAATTLAWMAAILGFLFLGVSVLAHQMHVMPLETQTVPSQIAKATFGETPLYYLVQASTTMILVLAANTSFADFPRLASILARDGFLPRQFSFRGDRLNFSHGIGALAILASVLLVIFAANTNRLIPLYALGVFLSFTLSQSGMVVHWWKLREAGWRRSIVINGIGAVATGVVAVIIALTKFTHGAWISLLGIGFLIYLFTAIRRHYRRVDEQLEVRPLAKAPTGPQGDREHGQVVLVPVDDVNEAVRRTVEYARTVSENVTALHVSDDAAEAEEMRQRWEEVIPDVPIVIIESPYRSFIAPILAYVDAIDRSYPGQTITVVLPELVPRHFWQGVLHNQSAIPLKRALLSRPNTVVIGIPYRLRG